MQPTEILLPAKDKGVKRFKLLAGTSAAFMKASERAEVQFALPICYFTARDSTRVDLEHTKRLKRSSSEESDLQVSGSEASK